jgi:hypothetical protein
MFGLGALEMILIVAALVFVIGLARQIFRH